MNSSKHNEYPANQAIWDGEIEGIQAYIVTSPILGGLNGYAVFPKRPTIEDGYGGILTYVPVHGGITYAQMNSLGMVYGFDTGHHDSHELPRSDHEWIKAQIAVMIKGIRVAAEVEKNYLRCITTKGKAKWCQKVIDVQPDQWQNFCTMINVLSGDL